MTLETGVKALAEAVATDVKALAEGKVDKVAGKGLSESNYTAEEKSKLAGIADEATKNRADSENADKVHNHTVDQVTGLDTALAGKAANTDPRFTDAREWTATTITQAEVEAGTAKTRRAFTAERLRQGITAWYTGISGTLGRTILGRSTAAQVRGDLGLGTAATKDAVSSNTDTTAGRLLQVGSGGWMGYSYAKPITNITQTLGATTSFAWSDGSVGFPYYAGHGVTFGRSSRNENHAIFFPFGKTSMYLSASEQGTGAIISTVEVYTTGNTTLNPDGTLKASSPVINLYTDNHDLHNESQFGATPAVVRKSKGVYEITGTLGLRSEGWYLDTPSDRNGNKYFNIEWTQNITPDAVDGVVDEYRDDIVVTIETFERVWNKETGMFDNGAPMDINDLQDRFVQLRFNEIKAEHEELVDETISRNQE